MVGGGRLRSHENAAKPACGVLASERSYAKGDKTRRQKRERGAAIRLPEKRRPDVRLAGLHKPKEDAPRSDKPLTKKTKGIRKQMRVVRRVDRMSRLERDACFKTWKWASLAGLNVQERSNLEVLGKHAKNHSRALSQVQDALQLRSFSPSGPHRGRQPYLGGAPSNSALRPGLQARVTFCRRTQRSQVEMKRQLHKAARQKVETAFVAAVLWYPRG